MGYCLGWVSAEGLSRDEVLDRLGIVDTGEPTDFPRRTGFMWAVTPEGRVVVVTPHYGSFKPEVLAELSAGAALVAARAESNARTSAAWGYEDGRQAWAVRGVDRGVRAEGEVPAIFEAIHADLLARQAAGPDGEVDLRFDVAIELAGALGGWTPESLVGEDLEFFAAREPPPTATDATRRRGPPLHLAIRAWFVRVLRREVEAILWARSGSSPWRSCGRT